MNKLIKTIVTRAVALLNPTTDQVLKSFDRTLNQLSQVSQKQRFRANVLTRSAIDLQLAADDQMKKATAAMDEAAKAAATRLRIEKMLRG